MQILLGEGGNLFHLLTDCLAFTQSRGYSVGWYEKQDVEGWTISSLVKFIDKTPLVDIFRELEPGSNASLSIVSMGSSDMETESDG